LPDRATQPDASTEPTMTLQDAIAQQPAWLGYWLMWLTFGGFILPLALLIWRQSRLAAVLALVANVAAAFAVEWIFDRLGFVKLLGLPHILFLTPLVVYFIGQARRPDMPEWPKRILVVVIATLLVSLAFDYTDVARYVLGERAPLARLTTP
jgi:hypothetical protein